MKIALTSLAVVAIVVLGAAAIVHVELHGQPVALRLALN